MLFQKYMTGRGKFGYGFRAQTTKAPTAPYLTLRSHDTGDTNRYLLEIMTTSHRQLSAVGSCHDREQNNGFSEFLFPDPTAGEEWEAILDNPGRLLYLPHISKREFLDTSSNSKYVNLGPGDEYELPSVTHKYDDRFEAISDDVLADLAADVWYASSQRIANPNDPDTWKVVRITLTDVTEGPETTDIGREFYCNVLMPALPRFLRSAVSVSIGGRFSDVSVSNKATGGAAAVLITLPEEKPADTVGSYTITPAGVSSKPLDPLDNEERWREFGRAILAYARAERTSVKAPESYLSDFFAVVECIGQNEAYEKLGKLTVNWTFAYLFYNEHTNCDDAEKHRSDYADDASDEDLQQSFVENVWEVGGAAFLRQFDVEEQQARNCCLWLEKHMLSALLRNERITVDAGRYGDLVKGAFTLDQIKSDAVRSELRDLYARVMLRGTTDADGKPAFECLLGLLRQPDCKALFDKNDALFSSLLQKASAQYKEVPNTELLRTLADYAQSAGEQRHWVVDYAIGLLQDVDCSRLKAFRIVQQKAELDLAVREDLKKYHRLERFGSEAFRKSLIEYADARTAPQSLSKAELQKDYAEGLRTYIGRKSTEYRHQLDQVRKAFSDIGMEQSDECMDVLTTCLDSSGTPFAEADVSTAVFVLSSDRPECAENMQKTLTRMFSESIPALLKHCEETPDTAKADTCWHSCLTSLPADKQDGLRDKLAQALLDHVTQESRFQKMPVVRNAFRELGLEAGEAEQPDQALCACAEASFGRFTEQDTEIIRQVLHSSSSGAERMAAAMTNAFSDDLDNVVRGSGAAEAPWKLSFEESGTSRAQEQLKQGIRERLLDYIDANADDPALSFGRAAALLKEYKCFGSDRVPAICAKLLRSQASQTYREEALTEEDWKALEDPQLWQIDPQARGTLTEAVYALFDSRLPLLFKDADLNARWLSLLQRHNIPFKDHTAASVHGYILQNASELSDDIPGVMDVSASFGGSGRQRMSAWVALLGAQQQKDRSVSVLQNTDSACLKSDMLREADADTVDALLNVFSLDLEPLLTETDLTKAAELNKKLSGSTAGWAEGAQKALAAFVDRCTERLAADKSGNDRLSACLRVASAFGWKRTEPVRTAIVNHFLALDRTGMDASEIRDIVEIGGSATRDAENGLQKVFCRSLPSLLTAGSDVSSLSDWAPAVGKVDLKTGLAETVRELRAESSGDAGDAILMPLLGLGDALPELRGTAAELSIGIIDDRRKARLEEGIVSHLMSEEEFRALHKSVTESKQPLLVRRFADLLAYEPSDPENADNQKALRRRMSDMRTVLYTDLTPETAGYAVQKHPVWKQELQQSVLDRVKKITSAEGQDFQSLCRVPERWNNDRGDLRFAAFDDLNRYVSDRSLLEEAAAEGARKTIGDSPLDALTTDSFANKDHWFAALIARLISERAGIDLDQLVRECKTPQDVKDLFKLLPSVNAYPAKKKLEAISYILNESEAVPAAELHRYLRSLGEDNASAAVSLLQNAVFGEKSDEWNNSLGAVDCADRIPMAAICWLTGSQKDWASFFDVVLRDTDMSRNALSCGSDPVQALMFASSVLTDLDMKDEADELPEQLRSLRPEEYRHVRAIGRKRKELSAVSAPETWAATGASESLFRLIFGK